MTLERGAVGGRSQHVSNKWWLVNVETTYSTRNPSATLGHLDTSFHLLLDMPSIFLLD